jgi:hypothetical protein
MTSIVCARCQAGRHLAARTGFEANGVVRETHTFAEGPRVRIPVPPPVSLIRTCRSLISWRMRREVSSRCSTAGSWQSSTVSSFFIFGWPGAAHGASIECARPPYRRAGPEQQRHTLAAGWRRARRSTNLPLLPPRDRHQPQADRSEQPHPKAVPSWPGLSPLPLPVGLARLSVDNRSPVGAVSLRPKPKEAPPPIPFRFALWFRRGVRLRAFTVTLSHCFAGRTSGSCPR